MTKYIRHPLCIRKIDKEWFIRSSFFVLMRHMAQRWDIGCVFFCLPSLNASDSSFIALISSSCSFGLQCSVIRTLSFTGVLLTALPLAWTAAESVLRDPIKSYCCYWSQLVLWYKNMLLLLKNWLIPTRTLSVFSQGLPKSRVWRPGCNEIRYKSFAFSLEKKLTSKTFWIQTHFIFWFKG